MVIENQKLLDALTVLGNAVAKKITRSVVEQKIELVVEDGVLYGYASDTINNMRVAISDTTEDLLAVVDYNILYNLIKVNTNKDITLTTDSRALLVKSPSVKCKLPILKDASDNVVRISDFWKKITMPTTYKKIDFSDLKSYMGIIKSVIIENFVIPCYSGVFFAKDYILASDTDNAIKISKGYFDEDGILLTARAVEYMAQLKEVDYNIDNNMLFIKTDNVEFITLLQDKSEYQAEDISNLFTVSMDYTTTFDGESFNTGLSTSKLFDFAEIGIDFTKDGLFITHPSNDFNFRVSENTGGDYQYKLKYDCANRLMISKDEITIHYGDPHMIIVAHDEIQGLFSTGA